MLNVFSAFDAYEAQPASQRLKWRQSHPGLADLIDQIKDIIGDVEDQ